MPSRVTSTPARRPTTPRTSTASPSSRLDRFVEAASKLRRGSGSEGSEALLTGAEAKRLRTALASAPKKVSTEVVALAASFDGPGAEVASALLLRAATARAGELTSAGSAKAMTTLRAFASAMRGLDAATLRARATVLDLESDRNDSRFDAQTLWARRGAAQAIETHGLDAAGDNDGLLQRFTSSCGPTVLQMVMAEADPVLAFAISEQGRASISSHDATAEFQRAVLEEFGGVGIPRLESHLAARLENGLASLVRSGAVTTAQRDSLVRHATARGPLDTRALVALEALRGSARGFPSDAELKTLRTAIIPARDEGLGTAEFQRALAKYAKRLTGLDYQMTNAPDGFGRGQAKRHLNAVEAALARGVDVPFGVSDPGHWMLLTNVRRVGGAREFLVSDPDGGRTAWVKEKDLASGAFGVKPFALNAPGERPYIDCFFLPNG